MALRSRHFAASEQAVSQELRGCLGARLGYGPPDRHQEDFALQVDQLVAELLARGDMNDDTTLELNRILADWRADKLDPGDGDYVQALHAKITQVTPETASDEPIAPPLGHLDGLGIEEWRDRALKAEAALAQFEEAARNG